MKTRSKRIKKSPINFRAEGLAVSATWVDILCREIKHTIFNIYTTSLTSRVLFDNKVLIVALSMFKQLQIIALCFLPQVRNKKSKMKKLMKRPFFDIK